MKSVFDSCVKPDWTRLWESVKTNTEYSVECDDRESILTVVADNQGDIHLYLIRHPKAEECGGGFGGPTFRARTFAGGGRNERIRIALSLLALAITEDVPITEDVFITEDIPVIKKCP